MHTLPHSVPTTLQQATASPWLCWTLLETHRQVWFSLLWGHCPFLLDAGMHKILFVHSKNLFLQSCISFCGSVMGLMATSSKRAYDTPKSSAPRAPLSLMYLLTGLIAHSLFDSHFLLLGHLYLLPPSSLLYITVWISLGVPGYGEHLGIWVLARFLASLFIPPFLLLVISVSLLTLLFSI